MTIEIPDSYPQKIKDILRDDIQVREQKNINDPVVTAYKLAAEMHAGQKRKGREQLDYITHPLQVYDMVKKCIGDYDFPDKDLTLAASLLHDTLEDYKKEETDRFKKLVKAGINPGHVAKGGNPGMHPLEARDEAARKIRKAFSDENFAENLISVLGELTNPIKFEDEEAKRQYQVAKAYSMSESAKLIKVCDKTLNIISNIEEVPRDWDYKKLMSYTNTATAVVKSAVRSVDEKDTAHAIFPDGKSAHAERVKKPDTPASIVIKLAGRVYSDVSDAELEILKNMRTAGKPIPSNDAPATFSMEKLVDNARSDGGKIHGFSR